MANIITLEDMNKDLFYKLPKAFFHNPKYMFLKNESKMAYSLLRDLLSLSIRNGWVNINNEPFVRISREKLMVRLQVKGTQKMAQIMKELVDNELIVEKKLGQGNTNIIYVCIPDELQNIIYDDEELLAAITDKELDSCDLQLQSFENQNPIQTLDSQESFEKQRSKQHAIKGLKSIISKSKTIQKQSVIETNSTDTNSSETNNKKNLLQQKDDVDKLSQLLIDHWRVIHPNMEMSQTTLAVLLSMRNRFDEDLLFTLIEISINSTQNINGYIRSVAASWTKDNIRTFDDYFEKTKQ